MQPGNMPPRGVITPPVTTGLSATMPPATPRATTLASLSMVPAATPPGSPQATPRLLSPRHGFAGMHTAPVHAVFEPQVRPIPVLVSPVPAPPLLPGSPPPLAGINSLKEPEGGFAGMAPMGKTAGVNPSMFQRLIMTPLLPPPPPVPHKLPFQFRQPGPDNISNFNETRRDAALNDWKTGHVTKEQRVSKRRRRINCLSLLYAIFLPWVLYLAVYALAAFELHYLAPITTNVMVLFIFCVCCRFAVEAHRHFAVMGEDWFFRVYISSACLVAVVTAWLVGDHTFWAWMQPAINSEHLATYNNVDPSSHVARNGAILPSAGTRYQDAGSIYFTDKAVIDQSKAMAFKLSHLYCVAPIVNPECTNNCGYDFWAVGVDCCSEDASDFRCGEYSNPRSKSGIRMMYDWQRPYFRLAVLEAEGAHDIMSVHPLFFYWMEDPVGSVRHWKFVGYKRFLIGMFGAFLLNACVLGLTLKLRLSYLQEGDRIGSSDSNVSKRLTVSQLG